ncbi:MAG: DNA recombination protein RmuC, partial [Flavobacteriaceae bacterium]|nr:DNA recombination protein RmuC [Flavobacteriaceae bacterium]
MNPYLLAILIAIPFLILGFFAGKLISKLNNEKNTSGLEALLTSQKDTNSEKEHLISKLEGDLKNLRDENQEVNIEFAKKVSELEYSKTKLAENKKDIENLQEKFTKEFKLLASEILENNSSKFTRQNKENLDLLLNPLQKKIAAFEVKVENSQKESFGMHSALKEQLAGLKDLNQ